MLRLPGFHGPSVDLRTLVGFVLCGLLCAVLGVTSILGMQFVSERVETSRHRAARAIEAVELASSVAALNAVVGRYVSTGSPAARNQAVAQQKLTTAAFDGIAAAGGETFDAAGIAGAFAGYRNATDALVAAVDDRMAAAGRLNETSLPLTNATSAIAGYLSRDRGSDALPSSLRLNEFMQASLLAATRYLASQNPADADSAKTYLDKLGKEIVAFRDAGGAVARLQAAVAAIPDFAADYGGAIDGLINRTNRLLAASQAHRDAAERVSAIAETIRQLNLEAQNQSVVSANDMLEHVTAIDIVIAVAVFLAVGMLAYIVSRSVGKAREETEEAREAAEAANRATQAANQSLESRVRERTAALQAAQQELLRAERLSVLGQVTATVAHELRNPLSAIRNSLFAVKEVAESGRINIERPLGRIDRSIGRCDRIIDELLDYTRARELALRPVEADAFVEEVLAEQKLPETIRFERRLAARCRIEIDVDRVRRVIVNLVENAVQAMAEQAREKRLTVATSVRGGRFVLTIEDSGPGIPADVLPKIFEPLFSTKSFGTGLGLPLVKQIVDQHGGSIAITSEPGIGTKAAVLFAIAAEGKSIAA